MDLRLPYPPQPEYARKLAERCVDAVRRVSGKVLDYSKESVGLVEQEVEALASQGNTVEAVASTLFCFGCYLGEVIVRHAGGDWMPTEASNMKGLTPWPMVVAMPDGDCWNPIGKVFKHFEDPKGEGITYFFGLATKR